MFRFSAFLTSRFPSLVKEHGIVKRRNVPVTKKPSMIEETPITDSTNNVEELNLFNNAWRRRAGIWNLDTVPSSPVSVSLSEHTTWNDIPSIPSSPVTPSVDSERREDVFTISTLLNSGSQRNRNGVHNLLDNICRDGEAACHYHEKFLGFLGLSLTGFLEALADASLSRFEESGEPAYLDSSLTYIAKAKEKFFENDDGDAAIPTLVRLCHLEASGLSSRFKHSGNISDITGAIMGWESAVSLTQDEHVEEKAKYLGFLASSLQARFEHLEELSDLEDAIATQREAIHLIADAHPNKPGLLNNLGASLEARFERLGELVDVDEAIASHHLAAQLIQ